MQKVVAKCYIFYLFFFFNFKFITTYLPRSYAPECIQMYINVNSKSLERTVKNTWKKRDATLVLFTFQKQNIIQFQDNQK